MGGTFANRRSAIEKKPPGSVPVKKPPLLYGRTQKILAQVEAALGIPCLAYWTSPAGSVCHNDVIGLYEVLTAVGAHDQVALFIKSEGGSGKASLRMIHVLRQYVKRLTALVPLECASAATMLALGADEIHMGPLAYLTAIDTSLRHDLSPTDIDNDLVSVSQDELYRVIKLWKSNDAKQTTNPYEDLFKYVHPLVIGAVDRASSLSMKLCQEILSYHLADEARAIEISEHLNSRYPSHAYPITLREAQRIGLPARALPHDVNELLLDLNGLYSEMGQRALTDYDEFNYHNNEIANIIEGRGAQIYYQIDKDWHYRKEERRWVSMNDDSSWRRIESAGGEIRRSVFHVR